MDSTRSGFQIWGLTAIEFLAAFSALSIFLGFTFFVGFCWQLGWHLLQFVSAQDYAAAAAYYVFPLFIMLYGFSRQTYGDYDRETSFSKLWNNVFMTDAPAITVEEAQGHMSILKITKVTIWLAFFSGLAIILLRALRWDFLPVNMLVIVLIVCSLPYTLVTSVHSIWLERSAQGRRDILARAIIILSTIIMFVYGLFEGGEIANAQQNDVTIHMRDGHEIDGVYVYRFSTGVAVRYIGGTSIHIVPDEDISDVELTNFN